MGPVSSWFTTRTTGPDAELAPGPGQAPLGRDCVTGAIDWWLQRQEFIPSRFWRVMSKVKGHRARGSRGGAVLPPPAAGVPALLGWWPQRSVSPSAFTRPPPRDSASSLLTRTPAIGFRAHLLPRDLIVTNDTCEDPVSKQSPFLRLRVLGDTTQPRTMISGRHLTLHGLSLSIFKTGPRDPLFGGL